MRTNMKSALELARLMHRLRATVAELQAIADDLAALHFDGDDPDHFNEALPKLVARIDQATHEITSPE